MKRLIRIYFWTHIFTLISLLVLFLVAVEIYPEPKVHPDHVHHTIYLERNFDDFEQEAILKASLEWSSTTNNIVQFDIVQLPTREKINLTNAIIVTKVSPDFPTVILLDTTNDGTTLGYFDRNSLIPHIALITDRIKDKDYAPVVLHEIGHALGLDHNEGIDGIGTLMFPSIDVGSNHITLKDGEKFCKLYHCDPMKLKYQEESFHF
jgi:hypothetical protein